MGVWRTPLLVVLVCCGGGRGSVPVKGSTGIPTQHALEVKAGGVDTRGGVVTGAGEQQQPTPAAAAAAAPPEAAAAAVPDACLMDGVLATLATVGNALNDLS